MDVISVINGTECATHSDCCKVVLPRECFVSSEITLASLSPSSTRNSINLWHKFSSFLDLNESFAAFLEEIEKEIGKYPCGRSYGRQSLTHFCGL